MRASFAAALLLLFASDARRASAQRTDAWFEAGRVAALGSAERALRPGVAELTLVVAERSTSRVAATRAVRERMRRFRAALLRIGVPRDAIGPADSSLMRETQPRDSVAVRMVLLRQHPGGVRDYGLRTDTHVVVREAVAVRVAVDGRLRSLFEEARHAGVSTLGAPTYRGGWTNQRQLDAATAEALERARTAAAETARRSGGRLGRLLSTERELRTPAETDAVFTRRQAEWLGALTAPRPVPSWVVVRARWEFIGPPGVAFSRVTSSGLEIPIAGVAVIRDSASWARLHRRFAQVVFADTGPVRARPAPVDFRREMLVAVSPGWHSGCVRPPHYIRRLLQRSDSVIVAVGAPERPAGPDCAMISSPVDVARLPRSNAPVAFVPADQKFAVPPPATWFWSPTPAEVNRRGLDGLGAFVGALLRDPQTPLSVIRALVKAGAGPGEAMNVALERPEVRADRALLAALAQHRHAERDTWALLVRLHGSELESDPATPKAVLGRLLLDRIAAPEQPGFRASVGRLLGNSTVRSDSLLFSYVVYSVRADSLLLPRVCRAFRSRWPPRGPAMGGFTDPCPSPARGGGAR